jgi:hypothetical protein
MLSTPSLLNRRKRWSDGSALEDGRSRYRRKEAVGRYVTSDGRELFGKARKLTRRSRRMYRHAFITDGHGRVEGAVDIDGEVGIGTRGRRWGRGECWDLIALGQGR